MVATRQTPPAPPVTAIDPADVQQPSAKSRKAKAVASQKKLNAGAQRAKDAAAQARAAQQAQPKPAKALDARGKERQAQRSKATLDAYVRANGSMSVARRTAVVGGSLERLGYSPSQSRDIALDAPLDARMHDADALTAALTYASSITPQAAAADPNAPAVIGADAIIPMPKRAQAALASAQAAKNPIKTKGLALHTGAWGFLDRIRNTMQPFVDRVADSPVPSGIGGLFALNLLFLAAIVPVNAQGYTRLQLLYLTLLNRTKLPEKTPPVHVPASPMFQAAVGAIASIEDAGNAVKSVASALGGDVSQTGNLLQTIGSAISVASGRFPGTGGGPDVSSTATGGGGDYIPRPPSLHPSVIPHFPGR